MKTEEKRREDGIRNETENKNVKREIKKGIDARKLHNVFLKETELKLGFEEGI